MEAISSLLKQESKSKATSERAEVLSYFIENLRDKKDKKFPPKRIAIALSHLKVSDLYYMKSVFADLLRCKGEVSAQKWFWWSIKSDKHFIDDEKGKVVTFGKILKSF